MLICFSIYFLLFSIAASSICSAATVYVDTNATGKYTANVTTDGIYICDGTNDEVEINKALAYIDGLGGGTVYLKGPNTYWIDATIQMGSNTILTGDSTACIKLIANAGWAVDVPLIRNKSGDYKNFTITGFEIDGNSEQQSVDRGDGYYNLMYFDDCKGITVTDMRLEWSTGDGLKARNSPYSYTSSANIVFSDNSVYKLGHDALYVLGMNGVTATNNDVYTRTNSAFRLSSSGEAKIYNNIIHSEISGSSTGPGIEIDKNSGYKSENIEIYNNIFHTLNGAAIWIDGEDKDNVKRGKNVHVHHNIMYNVGQYSTNTGYSNAAMIIGQFDNTIIENNVIDNGGHAAVKYYQYPNSYKMSADFTTIVRNNIILNCAKNVKTGIWNYNSDHHEFIVYNNCLYNNANGAYTGANIGHSDDIYLDPLFASSTSRDYHLKSKAGRYSSGKWVADSTTSPLIDAGYSKSSYSTEPSPNGGIINIGRYGNTAQASKSSSTSSPVSNKAPVAKAGSDKTVSTGSTVSFDGSSSSDDKGIAYYSWDFDSSNGISETTGITSTYKYSTAGTYTVTLTVTDIYGQKSTDTLIVVVADPDDPPVANADADKTTTTGSAVSFDGSSSTDDKGITTYSWDFDVSNGITSEASGKTATHTYTTAGTYTVTLTVTDTSGQTDTDTLKVVVSSSTSSGSGSISYTPCYDNRLRESLPTTVLSTSTYIDVGRSTDSICRNVMLFDLSNYKTTDTVSKATLSLYWYYPAGTTRSSATVVEIYRPCSWTPSSVTWNSWATAGGNWYDKSGVAQGSTPYATLTFPASTVSDNQYYEFDVTQLVQEYVSGKYSNTGFFIKAKTESDNYIAFYSSDCGDDAHKPLLKVTTGSGSTSTDNAPVANAGADKTATTGTSVSFDGSASTDDKGIATYSWDFNTLDGITSEATGVSTTHTFATAGTYTVTLTVTDTAGQKSTDTLQVVVSNSTSPSTGSGTYTPTYDNRLRESLPTSVLSTSAYIDVGRSADSVCRDVMLFDLSGYKTTDTISKATLSLYWYYPTSARTSATAVEIYRPVAWNPNSVTWNSWTTAGGNWYDKNGAAQGSTPYATLTFSASKLPDNQYYDFDVTQLVQEYVSGKYTNTGFFIKAKTESGNYIAFYSSDCGDDAHKPKLTITTASVDNAPVANAGADKTATTGTSVSFDGSASTDDKGIATYSWDFNTLDGITPEATGVSTTHTFATAGTYTVTLTVTDTAGQKSTDTLQVVVSKITSTISYTPTYDNRLRESSPTSVLSTSTFIDVGELSGSRYRDVMLFDLSSYKTTDTISKATLSLYWYYPAGTSRTSDTIVDIYRPVAWDTKSVTWTSGSWYDKNGVAQGSTPYATLTFPASTLPGNKYYDFDVTQLVQEYVSGKYTNTGFFLKAKTESGNYIAFYSSDWTTAAQRPKLTIIC
ncbi:disaggregatase related repeat-containing protein [uncultured Methanomethylovorans sp.]|uniref:disaggregatase related repeat-containing protein n=1 Tax=uncultured Methanomethylovorans sp. TaxID=183759 RepID=UPI003748D7FB